MLTKAEAHEFFDQWFTENGEKIKDFAEEVLASDNRGAELPGMLAGMIAVAMRVSVNAAIAIMDENNKRWEARLREAGVTLPDSP